MAEKKTTKKAPKKPSSKKAEREQLERKTENNARIASIIIFAVSLLFFFVAVLKGEGVWEVIHNVYIGIFGWFAAIVFPILCLIFSALYTVKNAERKMTFEIIMIVVLIVLISTFIHIVENSPGEKFGYTVADAFSEAPYMFNGGFIGGLFGWLLLTMGKAPAIVITLIVALVDVLLLSKATVNQFFKNTAKPIKQAVEKATPYIEERREKKRTRDIDIFLDDEPPGLDGEVKDNQTKKKRSKKTKDDEGENNGDDMSNIIKEINESTRRNQEEREKPNKSIDDIVKDASDEKKDAKEKLEKAAETPEFTVSDEDMNKSVVEYKLPPIDILSLSKQKSGKDISNELKGTAELLIDTLNSFGVSAEITDISRGPTVTRYELKPAAGVRISKIENLSKEIALNLAATNVRIEAPIPGKAAVGIEVPNSIKNMVSMREVIDTNEFDSQKSLLSSAIGKDIAGKTVFCDIAKMPHLLIAGTTGSGKSVCMNSIIVSILYRAKPEEVKFLMIDPKKVEFSKYENIPHLLVPVVTDPRKASGALGWAVAEMLKRYQAFSDTGVRDISGYNKYVKKHKDMEPMPKIVICIDELADLMMGAPKEVEDSICRLAQMARAAGMHLVIATQRPSVDVITGLIKANISSRIALTVSSAIDSRTILDTGGAEKLLGRGDMLYSPIGSTKPMRVQGCFISDEEVEELCDYIKNQGESQYSEEISKEIENRAVQEKGASNAFDDAGGGESLDPLFEQAVDVVLDNGRASTSFLQRKLGVGYSRGSKIMDQLEEKGVIGPQDGAKPREIRINKQQWIQMQANGPAPEVEFTNENTEQMSFEPEEEAAEPVSDLPPYPLEERIEGYEEDFDEDDDEDEQDDY